MIRTALWLDCLEGFIRILFGSKQPPNAAWCAGPPSPQLVLIAALVASQTNFSAAKQRANTLDIKEDMQDDWPALKDAMLLVDKFAGAAVVSWLGL